MFLDRNYIFLVSRIFFGFGWEMKLIGGVCNNKLCDYLFKDLDNNLEIFIEYEESWERIEFVKRFVREFWFLWVV